MTNYVKYELHPGGKELLCDFCSSPAIVKDYACETFKAIDVGPLVAESVGKWVACAPCAELIDADKWEELAQHSFETVDPKFHELPVAQQAILIDFIRQMHGQFRQLRMRAN
jgi:hypothetical protein